MPGKVMSRLGKVQGRLAPTWMIGHRLLGGRLTCSNMTWLMVSPDRKTT